VFLDGIKREMRKERQKEGESERKGKGKERIGKRY